MSGEPEFLTVEDVLVLHEESLTRYGGGAGIRDRGALESAVALPTSTFGGDYLHADLFAMAAAYAFHIAQNQPFVDGNKRTALAAALVFLDFNDVEIEDPDERLYEAMIAIAERRLDKEGFSALFRELVGP